VQLGKSDRLVAGLAQSLQQPLLLASPSVIDWIVALQGVGGTSSVSNPHHTTLDVWRLGVWSPPAAASRRS
jgi:hypothetical protein